MQVVGVHERFHRGKERLRFRPVPFKSLDAQWEPVHVSEHADGDLRINPALLTEPGLTEPVTFVSFPVEGGYVVEHQ